MKLRKLAGTIVLLALAGSAGGCAAIPFVPMMASAAMKLVPDRESPPGTTQAQPLQPDPAIAKAITAMPAQRGDTGLDIDQQDRVSFQPTAQGSIPLRVAAVDLVGDIKAHAVGDIVTVNVSESIASEAKAGTSLSNKRAVSGGIPGLFGATTIWGNHNPSMDFSNLINASSSNSTDGSGDMTANDTFTANVSAVVTQVNPSGTLSITGNRQVQINGENDTIHLSGTVRPQDIDSNDSIASSQVADLEVSISGSGQIRDKQGNGLGTRLFDWVWPF
jgi:flagellar L-ring protein FlgH